jgi:regulator of protease activity HflC (stomatin/prohibitin superfamily)
MVKRFVERFELWREEKRQEREDSEGAWLLFLAAVVVGQAAYSIIASGELVWRAMITAAVVVVFVTLYTCRSRYTWIVPLAGAVALAAEAAVLYFAAPVSLSHLLLLWGFAVAVVVYSFRLRHRFTRDDAPTI